MIRIRCIWVNSGMYGPANEAESIAAIHVALDHGVTLLDTGDFYGMGNNEMLTGCALKGRRAQVLLSVQFGVLRGLGGCSPQKSLAALGARHVTLRNVALSAAPGP